MHLEDKKKTFRRVVREALERDDEAIRFYPVDYDYERDHTGSPEYYKWMDRRCARHATALADQNVPASYMESLADVGWPDVEEPLCGIGAVRFSSSWLQQHIYATGSHRRGERLFDISDRNGFRSEQPQIGFWFGDVYENETHCIATFLNYLVSDNESVWYYGCVDPSPTAIPFAPIGVDYYDVLLAHATGLADALFASDEDSALAQNLDDSCKALVATWAPNWLANLLLLAEHPVAVTFHGRGFDRQRFEGRVAQLTRVLGSGAPSEIEIEIRGLAPVITAGFSDAYSESSLALLDAARERDAQAMNDLLSKDDCDINIKSPKGETPLILAIQCDALECVRLLIDAGADLEAADEMGNRPLHLASWREQSILELLLEHGADAGALNRENEPTIFGPIQNENLDALRLLLEAGADPNVQSDNGWFAIQLARTDEIKKLLREFGAKDVD